MSTFGLLMLMEAILKAQRNLDCAKQQLQIAVQEARSAGRTWAEIGETLGISRQAAFKRFGEVINPVNGQKITGAPMAMQTIRELTERVFDLISTADYQQLEQLIHPDVREELTAELIADTWQRVLTDIGAKETYDDTHVALPAGQRIDDDEQLLGTVVGVTTLQHEAGEAVGRVAVDDQQKVVGILILPPDHGPVPF